MARLDELKRRVARLMSGDLRTRDLDAIFLWLRERSFGNRAVADIGDFVAHSDERDKGTAWQGAQWFFDSAALIFPKCSDTPPVPSLSTFKRGVMATFELIPAEQSKKVFGMGKNKGRKFLTNALSRVLAISDKGYHSEYDDGISPREQEVIKTCCDVLVCKPAFTGQHLASQFSDALQKNGLARGVLPKAVADFVALFAVEKMHLARIILRDGASARLGAAIMNDNGYTVGVYATADIDYPGGPVGIGFPIYVTGLDAPAVCEPSLLPFHPSMGSNWDFPLEIGPTGKLQML